MPFADTDYEEKVLASPAFRQVYREVAAITSRHRPELAPIVAKLQPFSEALLQEPEVGLGDEDPGHRREVLAFLLNRALHPF